MNLENLEPRLAMSAGHSLRAGTGDLPSRASNTSTVVSRAKSGRSDTAGPRIVSGNTSENLVTPGTNRLALQADALPGGGIRIRWEPLGLVPEGQIVIFRKAPEEDDWTAPAVGEPAYNATSFDDLTAVTGVVYEYKVVVYGELGAAPSEKYILAGNAAAPTHSRGTVLLVVEATHLNSSRDAAGTTLLPALQRYQADLIAEGYSVRTLTAPRVDIPRGIPADLSPESIAAYFGPWSSSVMALKAQIRAIHAQTPDLASILLLGHVAVPYSGIVNPDGVDHAGSHGAWPADVFYGTLTVPDSAWSDTLDSEVGESVNRNLPGDGKFDQDQLFQLGAGTEIENNGFADVPVGRVDFAMLDGFDGISASAESVASLTETRLLSRYLEKSHEWRTGQWDVQQKALFDEAFPFPEYYDTNRLTPNVGLGQVVSGMAGPNESSVAPQPQRYDLHEQTWLWLYAGAPGYPSRNNIQLRVNRALHTDHYINGAWARPGTLAAAVDEGAHKAVFNFIYGSYIGDWDQPRSLLRGAISEPDGLGLAAAWGARPNWNQHHMGLGEPIGVSLEKSLNNFGAREAYMYDPNQGSVRLSLLGDPTLRQANVVPPTDVATAAGDSGVGTRISWEASSDANVAGYYVYRSATPGGPFTLLNPTMTATTTFVDSQTAPTTEAYYMVRAAKLQLSASGTYWNLSLGASAAPHVTSAKFLGTRNPHALEVTFSQDISLSLAATDVLISGLRRNFVTGANVPISLVADSDFHLASYDPLTRTARFEFDAAGPSVEGEGVLPSGRYTLSFAAGAVTNAFDVAVDDAYSFQFGYLLGDANGDLKVDFSDLVIVAQRYGSTVTDGSASGDFNDDGVVNFDDLVALAQRYGAVL